jgi:hypothetical protein
VEPRRRHRSRRASGTTRHRREGLKVKEDLPETRAEGGEGRGVRPAGFREDDPDGNGFKYKYVQVAIDRAKRDASR